MARSFKILGTEITIGKRLFGLGKDEDSFGIAQVYGTDNKSYNLLDTYKGIVYACINLIAESCGSYAPAIYKRNKNQWEDIGEHELLKLLRRPGGYTDRARPISRFDLFYATASFIELQGECYWYIAKGKTTGKPREIVVLRADRVGKKIDDQGEIEYFFVRQASGQNIRIEIDEMLPFVGFNPKYPYSGVGTVQAAIDYIKTDEFSTTFTKNFFKNNAGISGVLSIGGDLMRSAFKKFVRAWRDKYQGVDNAGKVMIVRGSDAAKFEKVGLGLNELDMSSLRNMSLDDIAMMFRVPLPLLGKITQGAGFGRGNIETLEYIFAKYNIDKKMDRYDAILLFALERYYGLSDSEYKIGHVSTIPEDKEHELNERDKGVDRWITRNEIRAEEGKPPIQGGDELRAPLASLPINESLLVGSNVQNSNGSGIKVKIIRKEADGQKKKTKLKLTQ